MIARVHNNLIIIMHCCWLLGIVNLKSYKGWDTMMMKANNNNNNSNATRNQVPLQRPKQRQKQPAMIVAVVVVRCTPPVVDPREMKTILDCSLKNLFGDLEPYSCRIECCRHDDDKDDQNQSRGKKRKRKKSKEGDDGSSNKSYRSVSGDGVSSSSATGIVVEDRDVLADQANKTPSSSTIVVKCQLSESEAKKKSKKSSSMADIVPAVRAALTLVTLPPYIEDATPLYRFDVLETHQC